MRIFTTTEIAFAKSVTAHQFSTDLSDLHPLAMIAIFVRMSAGGYAYGQKMNLNVSVHNKTPFTVGNFIVKILRVKGKFDFIL